MSARMHAIVQSAFGGPEVLTYAETDVPEPGPGEVLLRVAGAGVNPGDAVLRAGRVPELVTLPWTPGNDVAGVVERVGEGVTRFVPGDEVYGMLAVTRRGAYAEFAAAPADALAPAPRNLDLVHAGAVPLAAFTAWQALVVLARLQPGDRVLIHAAAGGVGHVAVQLAKELGAHVIGTARAANHDFLHGLGADELVDYTATDFRTAVAPVDTVLDLVGGSYGPSSLDVLRPGGLLIGASIDPGTDEQQAVARGLRYVWVTAEPSGEVLERITERIEAGRLRVTVQRTYPLAEAAAAHRAIEEKRTTGKIVLVP
ncbi:NADPH:quinone reductase-like Zn-dependent oxidoreductase [Streptomyces sp. Ag109_O5-1]|uniref:NADP-dependent oxidoreductase n=1 Tax=Streptomyces sp. Ag109_O5-1 TaxID=1938851 RepID=UPI000F4D2F5B|nr:NADP-dependent oxidoreductase [Streptomyces sp. Ag109_O5-1]RPE43594.1 NADPH:quinone reductase-like Zn-dependent oxidoreductase [Streptomyces sp. Ag109_O5-1]